MEIKSIRYFGINTDAGRAFVPFDDPNDPDSGPNDDSDAVPEGVIIP